MISVRMLFFAHLSDAAGQREELLFLPDGATVQTAANVLQQRGPEFSSLLDHVRVAVNAEFASSATALHDGDEVAWMPPMSGGTDNANLPLLTREPMDIAALSRVAEASGYGAVVTFAGNVRDNARGRQVLFLEYEGYEPLAEKQLAALCAEAEARWNTKCLVQHRLGRLEIGECSVGIAVAAPHRAEAFEACRWLIDTLKETVPIWKSEYFAGGAHWVEGPNTVRKELTEDIAEDLP